MTAVLSATDALRKERHLSQDDSQFDYASAATDWRAKYHEVVDMLAETRNELEEFQAASKELEAEMEADLQRSEKLEQELKGKIARTEVERDDWKSKYMSLQTTHNTTATSLQRELDRLRQEHQQLKVQLRELEMGNDDLERTERAISSSLADMEAKYAKTLEEKILLEHELLEKANLEEQMQKLKDELRDSQDEIAILREQLASANAAASTTLDKVAEKPSRDNNSSPHISIPSDEDLLHSSLPSDLQLADISPILEFTPSAATTNGTPKANLPSKSVPQSALLQRAGLKLGKPTSLPSPINTSRTSSSSSFTGPRTPTTRLPPVPTRQFSAASAASTSTATSTAKSKGVQMVSEMRARVRVLEQKIHTRVPRLRMASITGRSITSSASTTSTGTLRSPSTSSSTSLATTAKTSLDSLRRSNDSDAERVKKDSAGDSTGWVLIMEGSPSPHKIREKERPSKEKRRFSNPSAPSAFKPGGQNGSGIRAPSPSPMLTTKSVLGQSSGNGIRRPQSRLSGASTSTSTTGSSLPTPISRPSTPTFLPMATSSLYSGSGTVLKRPGGPGGTPYAHSGVKRTSLGSNTGSPTPAVPPLPSSLSESSRDRTLRGASGLNNYSSPASSFNKYDEMKSLPVVPTFHQGLNNVTIRQTKLPSSASSLSKSRIGKPSTGRKSGGSASDTGDLFGARSRSGY